MSLIYTPSAEVGGAAEERLGNWSLQEQITDYLDGAWPPGFEEVDSPRAVYAPYMARGTGQELKFLDMARQAGLVPVVATYRGTEYVTNNPELVDCYRPPLALPKGQKRRQWIVDSSERPGSVGEAQTVYEGIDIQSYWAGVREAVLTKNGQKIPETVDFSEWYAKQAERFGWNGGRSKSSEYYNALMALYASGRAVLFDTPPTAFADRIMLPASQAAEETLGVGPLIVCEFPELKGRDWVNVSVLGEQACQQLVETGRIE